MMLRRALVLLAASVALIAVPLTASAATISARPGAHQTQVTAKVTHRPLIVNTAEGCSGDACIWLGSPSGGQVTVHGCAWKTTVNSGFVEISGPGGTGLPIDSSTGTWHSTGHYCTGADQYFSVTVSAVVGQYCATMWNGSSYDGTACENVT